jgi:predicted amidohydrolase YtcJ
LVLAAVVAALAGPAPAVFAQNLPPEVLNYADIVMYNGAVLTMDRDTPDFTVAQAVAVRDGRILAVGDTNTIMRMAGPQTRKIDLTGKAVMPGVIDTHSHPNRYALGHYQQEFLPKYLQWLKEQNIHTGSVQWEKGKTAALAQLKAIVAKAEPDDIVYVGSRGNPVVMNEIKLADLDAVAPNHDLFVGIGNEMWGLVNSRMLKKLTDTYGEGLAGIRKDANGNPTGLLFGTAGSVVGYELFPQTPPELLAPIFAKELEEWASIGVTTLSSRFKGTEISAYSQLAREGKLPIRIPFTHEIARWNPTFERDMKRLGNIQNYGISDPETGEWIWLIGLSVGIPDGSPPGGGGAAGGDVCSDLKKRERFPDDSFYETNGICYWDQPGDPTKETVLVANRYGYRIAGVHTFGDKGLEIMMDTYAQAAKEKDWTAPPAADHGLMISPEVIKKTDAADAMWSLQVPMFYGRRTSIVSRVFGEDIAHKWSMPVKSLMDAGVKVTYGADTHDDSRAPMHSLQVLVTRETHDGRVWGANERIDRRRALLMLTRFGAEYVLKADQIGSIEKGKLADLIVLDKNPLDPKLPDTQLKDIKVLETFIGGKVAWDAASGKTFPAAPRRPDPDME